MVSLFCRSSIELKGSRFELGTTNLFFARITVGVCKHCLYNLTDNFIRSIYEILMLKDSINFILI